MISKIFESWPLRADEYLSRIQWPDVMENELPRITRGSCLIVCAGFEERALAAWRRICQLADKNFSIGLITYLPFYSQNQTSSFYDVCRNTGVSVTEIPYDRRDPSGVGDRVGDFVRSFDHVFVDISGMSRLLIIQTLVSLLSESHILLTLIYSEAEDYPPSREQFHHDQHHHTDKSLLNYLSSGIFEITMVPELSSISMFGENIRLVAFPSFDPSHLANLVQELQPTYTDMIHGIPPAEENKWRTEAVRFLNRFVLDSLLQNTDHEASTLDYIDTLRILLDIYKQRSMFDRIIIAPTGSKMQAVAVALFRATLYNIPIVYPTPQTFTAPDQYTVGVRQIYSLDLPIDQIAECRRKFDGSME